MSEIEKMYKNAGVEYLMYVVDSFPLVEYPQIDFNEKKQLELIKWLARKGLAQINYSSHQYISEALASHCNNLWQDLTEEEKQQVKGILE